jgi:L-ascorbate oxidase
MRTLSLCFISTVAMLAGCGDSEGPGGAGGSGGVGGCVALADGSCVTETFANPPLLEPDANGVYQLELRPTEILIDGERHCGRGYNGQYPAPTIDTARSDAARSVRVDVHNAFQNPDYRTLSSGGECTCTDSVTGESCTPGHHGSSTTCDCVTPEGGICHLFDFNLTNLHAHGSHVRPDYATGGGCVERDGYSCRPCNGDMLGSNDCFYADDVLSKIEQQGGAQHRWDIDEDGTHHAGLQWYHPHIHGSTAIQVASGAAGAWIVRGELDEIPGIKDARERVMLITTPPVGFEPLAADEPCDEEHITFNSFAVLSSTDAKQTNLVNGVRRPRLLLAPGQIERWRLLHVAFLDEIGLALVHAKDSECKDLDLTRPPVGLTQIGRDGIPLLKPSSGEDWPFKPPYLFMSPGYRIEALLDGNELADGDTLCLLAGRFLQEDTTGEIDEPVGIQEPISAEDFLERVTNGDVIAIVNVTSAAGPPTETQMPDLDLVAAEAPSPMLAGGSVDALALCEQVKGVSKPEEIEQLSLMWPLFYNTEGLDQCAILDHNLNGKNFEYTDRERYPYDRVLELGAVDHWRLMSGFDGHPFHIHINPFLVCPQPPAGSPDPNVKSRVFEPPFAHWRDTYLVNLDRTIDVVTEYRAFTGSFVYHCHKLSHEDHGMMELLRVCDPATEDCDSLCDGRPCGWRECASDDETCLRALAATDCLLDPTVCPEAAVRCTPCDADTSCPAASYCGEELDLSGSLRCVPGCMVDADCPIIDRCDAGECVPAPPCSPPCAPPDTCIHGVCG